MRGGAVSSMMAAALLVVSCGTTDGAAGSSEWAGRTQGDVLEVACDDEGIAVDSDVVSVQADGLHVRATHTGGDHREVLSGTEHVIAVSLPGAGPVRSEVLAHAAPGAYELWCAGEDDEAPGSRPTAHVDVVDPADWWRASPPFECQHVVQVISHEPGLDLGHVAPGALEEVAYPALRREGLLDDGLRLGVVGYEEAPDGLVGVRDGSAEVSFHVNRDDQGNTHVGLRSRCAPVGD